MTSILQPPTGRSRLAERLRRHEPMLGALIAADQAPADLAADLDFVVLSGVTDASVSLAQRRPVLILVNSSADVPAAMHAGADAVIARKPIDGVDLVLSQGGRARLVATPQAARAAFCSGADLVVYDLPSMLADLRSALAGGRQPASAQSGREPLVLLSGMLGDASLWDGVAAHLGDTMLPWPARIDLDESVPEMAATVLSAAPERFALGGHSLGAIVALELMRQAPDRVTRLILINASGRGPAQEQRQSWTQWRHRTLDGTFDQIVAELALSTLAQPRRNDEAMVAANAMMARSVGAEGFLRQLTAQTTRPDSLDALGAIDVPVLVLSGELDEICPPALQQEIVAHCPHAQLVTIEGGGHMLPLEQPDAVAEHILTWRTSTVRAVG
ncbi:MAG: alpha/beta fold hydrolase [Mycobacteriales bacterium]